MKDGLVLQAGGTVFLKSERDGEREREEYSILEGPKAFQNDLNIE